MTVSSPALVARRPTAPRWYFTSPLAPSAVAATASIVRSPSNSRRISSYGRPMMCARTFRRPRWAMPITISCAPASAARLNDSSSIGTMHVEALDRELLLPEECAPQVVLEAFDFGQLREHPPLLVLRERLTGTGRTRSPGEARRAPDGPRCARSRRRSFRSRSPPAGAGRPRASRPRCRHGARTPGCAPAVRASAWERASSGSSAGSPTGSDPSGSRCAARCPCVRCALIERRRCGHGAEQRLSDRRPDRPPARGAGSGAGAAGSSAAWGGRQWRSHHRRRPAASPAAGQGRAATAAARRRRSRTPRATRPEPPRDSRGTARRGPGRSRR